MARITVFDLETTNLNADFGFIICGSYMHLDEGKVHTVKISDSPGFNKDCTNDKWVVRELAKALQDSHILVAHYGAKFDVPYLNARLLAHGYDPLPPIPLVDTWRTARYQLKIHRNSLQSLTEFFGYENKTRLSGPMWIKAMAGNRRAINYVVEHCEVDVRVLARVYRKLRPIIKGHPNVNLVNGDLRNCPVCGSTKLRNKGYTVARTRMYKRYKCRECGANPRSTHCEPNRAGEMQ